MKINFNIEYLPPEMITLALVNSGRSDFEISCPKNDDRSPLTLTLATSSTEALPLLPAASKFVPRTVNTLTESFAFNV